MLQIYLLSVALFYISYLTCAIDFIREAKKNGIVKKENKMFQIRPIVQVVSVSLVPVFNVCVGLAMLFSERVQKSLNESIKKRR